MNIIQEQRERVMRENNTAQTQLKGILEKYNKASVELSITEPLHGDLDFSILKEYGFININKITCSKGEITNIIGIPETVTAFICPDNLLLHVDALPITIQHIEIPHNYLETMDLGKYTELKKLIVNDNKLKTLIKFPPSINIIECSNNGLVHLDLIGIIKLERLNVSNNPITVIENRPEGIIDLQMENTPSVAFRNSAVPEQINVESQNKQPVIDALREYFRLKRNYEDKLHEMKKKAFDRAGSKRQAKIDISKINAPCVKCKRPVGTIFSKKNSRHSAVCGDVKSPCKLDIQIFVGDSILPFSYILNIYREDNEEIKDSIIRKKLDTLFNYTSEEQSIKIFKKELEEYNSNSKMFKQLLDKNNELYDDPDKKRLIEKKNGEIFRLIERNADLLKEYKRTNDKKIIEVAVQLQKNELLPEINNLRMLKYGIMEMNNNKDSEKSKNKPPEFYLFQYPTTLLNVEYNFKEPQRVIKFNK